MNAAFARAEVQGLSTALWIRLVALIAVQIWLLLAAPKTYTIFYHGWIFLFLLLGAGQLFLLKRRAGRTWPAYVFAVLDGLLVGMVLLMPNPLLVEAPPPAMILRYANIIFVFVLLAGAAFSYNPGLLLCTGLSTVLVWRFGVSLMASSPSAITSSDSRWNDASGMQETIALFLDPNFIHLTMQDKKVFVVVLVTLLLAAVVWRARRLVQNQMRIERARTNLARYFSPNLVNELADQDEPLGAVRRQSVAVLFADIQGFTSLSENMSPEAVVDLLRGFHERMETAIFAHGGTLDKYMGDGLMATFGTPNPGHQDATQAFFAAQRMLTEIGDLNRLRQVLGERPITLSIGIHYGPVVQGDIGGGRRLEFTVLGDTVNVASRLEAMTRELDTLLVISSNMVDQLRRERGKPDLDGMKEIAPQEVRGRIGRMGVWTLQAEKEA